MVIIATSFRQLQVSRLRGSSYTYGGACDSPLMPRERACERSFTWERAELLAPYTPPRACACTNEKTLRSLQLGNLAKRGSQYKEEGRAIEPALSRRSRGACWRRSRRRILTIGRLLLVINGAGHKLQCPARGEFGAFYRQLDPRAN